MSIQEEKKVGEVVIQIQVRKMI
ncbi:Protein of unknown function [Bacillus wiedmannii]|nr:Protein of unknown function [Bacillus wiedmannii]